MNVLYIVADVYEFNPSRLLYTVKYIYMDLDCGTNCKRQDCLDRGTLENIKCLLESTCVDGSVKISYFVPTRISEITSITSDLLVRYNGAIHRIEIVPKIIEKRKIKHATILQIGGTIYDTPNLRMIFETIQKAFYDVESVNTGYIMGPVCETMLDRFIQDLQPHHTTHYIFITHDRIVATLTARYFADKLLSGPHSSQSMDLFLINSKGCGDFHIEVLNGEYLIRKLYDDSEINNYKNIEKGSVPS